MKKKTVRSFPAPNTTLAWQVDNEAHQLGHKLQGGTLVLLDNWRVMHGRKEFIPNSGTRVIEIAFGDWNHLQSRVLHQE